MIHISGEGGKSECPRRTSVRDQYPKSIGFRHRPELFETYKKLRDQAIAQQDASMKDPDATCGDWCSGGLVPENFIDYEEHVGMIQHLDVTEDRKPPQSRSPLSAGAD